MVIDVTAEFSWLIPALLVCLAFSAAAVFAGAWLGAGPTPFAQQDRNSDMAIVGGSPSAPAHAVAAPSDTSVSEAA